MAAARVPGLGTTSWATRFRVMLRNYGKPCPMSLRLKPQPWLTDANDNHKGRTWLKHPVDVEVCANTPVLIVSTAHSCRTELA